MPLRGKKVWVVIALAKHVHVMQTNVPLFLLFTLLLCLTLEGFAEPKLSGFAKAKLTPLDPKKQSALPPRVRVNFALHLSCPSCLWQEGVGQLRVATLL